MRNAAPSVCLSFPSRTVRIEICVVPARKATGRTSPWLWKEESKQRLSSAYSEPCPRALSLMHVKLQLGFLAIDVVILDIVGYLFIGGIE